MCLWRFESFIPSQHGAAPRPVPERHSLYRSMSNLLDQVEHRPWPPPTTPWVMTQTWYDLLFAHWPVSTEAVRSLIPAELELDTYEGQAWLGVVPFGMTRVYPRGTLPVPWLS